MSFLWWRPICLASLAENRSRARGIARAPLGVFFHTVLAAAQSDFKIRSAQLAWRAALPALTILITITPTTASTLLLIAIASRLVAFVPMLKLASVAVLAIAASKLEAFRARRAHVLGVARVGVAFACLPALQG